MDQVHPALSTPTIAAVNGVAVGMGLTSVLSMDIRIASDQARFGAVFAKMGVVPELGGSYFLPQLIGLGRALEWCLSARLVPAAEAFEAGLVTAVVPQAEILDAAVEKAAAIAAHPAPHLAFAKQLIRANASNTDLNAVITSENDALALAMATWEHTEAITAFVQRRAPDYTAKPAEAR